MKCPDCNTKLTADETFDFGWENGKDDSIVVNIAGFCPTCGRKFLWTQHYALTSEDELEDDIY